MTERRIKGATNVAVRPGLLRGASITFAARAFALLLGILSSVILARALGPVGKGQYALIILIPALFQAMGGIGLDQATIYMIARRRDECRAITLSLVAASAGLGVLLAVAYAALSASQAYSRYLAATGVEPLLVWILIALLPITLALQILISAILALERYRAYNLATLIAPSLNLMLLVMLVVVWRLGIAGAVVASVAATLVAVAGATAILLGVAPEGRLRWPAQVLRHALSYGARIQVANIAWFLHYRADMFLIGYLVGPAALGFYATAVGLAEKLYLAPSAIGTVLFPRVAATDATETRDLTPRVSRHTLWLTLCLAVVLAAVAWPVVYLLFGTAFLPSVAPLWLLLPGVVSLAVGRVLSADLNGRGLPGSVARANSSMMLLNLALNLWWIPLWGIAGAAAATSISYSAAVFLLARRYRKASGATWSELILLSGADRANLVVKVTELARQRGMPRDAVQQDPPT